MAKIFLAGIIQGSIAGHNIHEQDYRERLKRIFSRCAPGHELYCPFENHSASLEYSHEEGERVFREHIEMAASSDVMLAYLPEASMGTAVEMWEAHNRGVRIITISPMTENWTVKFLSDRVFRDIAGFETFLDKGGLEKLLAEEGRSPK